MGRIIQGYCLRPHAQTLGESGQEKVWKPEHLKPAAETLAGCPVTTHEGENAQHVIGEVLYSEYVEDEGVRYEAEIHDEQVVEAIELGLTEIAPRMYHESMPYDSTDPAVPTDIEFSSLFTTPAPAEGVPEIDVPGMEPAGQQKI
jgi:hypothetical protein